MHIRNNDCKSDISEIDISDKFILFMTTSARIHHNARKYAHILWLIYFSTREYTIQV